MISESWSIFRPNWIWNWPLWSGWHSAVARREGRGAQFGSAKGTPSSPPQRTGKMTWLTWAQGQKVFLRHSFRTPHCPVANATLQFTTPVGASLILTVAQPLHTHTHTQQTCSQGSFSKIANKGKASLLWEEFSWPINYLLPGRA